MSFETRARSHAEEAMKAVAQVPLPSVDEMARKHGAHRVRVALAGAIVVAAAIVAAVVVVGSPSEVAPSTLPATGGPTTLTTITDSEPLSMSDLEKAVRAGAERLLAAPGVEGVQRAYIDGYPSTTIWFTSRPNGDGAVVLRTDQDVTGSVWWLLDGGTPPDVGARIVTSVQVLAGDSSYFADIARDGAVTDWLVNPDSDASLPTSIGMALLSVETDWFSTETVGAEVTRSEVPDVGTAWSAAQPYSDGELVQRWTIGADGLLQSWSFELIGVGRAADTPDPTTSGSIDYVPLDDPAPITAPETPAREYVYRLDLPSQFAIPRPLPAGEPSQSPVDAERDGVIAELALLPFDLRVSPKVEVQAPEGRWVLARPTDELMSAGYDTGCRLGNTVDGIYGVDVICITEYGEILLVDDTGQILRAYPMPGAVPSWLVVADEAVYAGRIGDGGLPDSTLVRIDRASLNGEVLLFPAPFDGGEEWPPAWRIVSAEEVGLLESLVMIGPEAVGTPAVSWIGNVAVDLDAIRRLFAGE